MRSLPPQSRAARNPFGRVPEREFRSCKTTFVTPRKGEGNQLRALRDGYSPAITADLAKLEHQLASVQARLKTSDPRTVKLQIRDTRRFVESRLEDLSALWDGDPRIAREEIAKHVGKITLKPMLRMYIATGVWVWFGVWEPRLLWWCRGPGMDRTSARPL
jgi:hypothetical protein